MAVHYQDRFITLDEDGITIRWYYFPAGTKRILYTELEGVETHTMGKMTGQWRIWGSGDLKHWFNLDPGRPNKTAAFILKRRGGWSRPILTPDRPANFQQVLEDKGIPISAG